MVKWLYYRVHKKSGGQGIKDKIMSLFRTNTNNDYSKPAHVNNVFGDQEKPRKPKIKIQSEDKIIKEINDRKIRDIKNLFDQEQKDSYKPTNQ